MIRPVHKIIRRNNTQRIDFSIGILTYISVPKELIDKESFEKIYKKVTETTKGDRNEFKLRRSSKNLLNQAKKDKKSAKKILKKVNKIDTELKKTTNDVISINDPESRWMLNKKSKWEFDYNLQIGVDDYKGIIISSSLTQNPTDVFELIPQIEQIKVIEQISGISNATLYRKRKLKELEGEIK